jgi:hypothetical protein
VPASCAMVDLALLLCLPLMPLPRPENQSCFLCPQEAPSNRPAAGICPPVACRFGAPDRREGPPANRQFARFAAGRAKAAYPSPDQRDLPAIGRLAAVGRAAEGIEPRRAQHRYRGQAARPRRCPPEPAGARHRPRGRTANGRAPGAKNRRLAGSSQTKRSESLRPPRSWPGQCTGRWRDDPLAPRAQRLHRGDRGVGHPPTAPFQPACAAPTTPAAVGQQHRRAIGGDDAQQQAGAVGNERVGLGPLGIAHGSARSRNRPNGPDRPDQPRARQHRFDRDAAVPGHRGRHRRPNPGPQLSPASARRHSAAPAEEAVRHARAPCRPDR